MNPDLARPELTVFELRDGSYVTEATSTQAVTVTRPFPVTITPAQLTKGLSARPALPEGRFAGEDFLDRGREVG